MKKFVVTGGAGFIGCCLAEKLAESGKDVLIYDNFSFGKMENIEDFRNKIEIVKGDLNDNVLLERTISEFAPDVVVHLAAIHFIPYCNKHPHEAVLVNVNGTHTLTNICSKYKPKKVLFASTAAVYPPSDIPYAENHGIAPFDIYGATKICGETMMELFALQTSVSTVSCRFFNVYGPKETNEHVLPRIIKQLSEGETTIQLGNTSPKRDYIYVGDMADALIKLSSADLNNYEIFNIGTGKEYSVKELISKIGTILGKDLTIQSVSQFKRKVDREHLCSNISKIQDRIGWSPAHGIDQGLSALIKHELGKQ